jgi:hypothetical protein
VGDALQEETHKLLALPSTDFPTDERVEVEIGKTPKRAPPSARVRAGELLSWCELGACGVLVLLAVRWGRRRRAQ